MQHVRNLKKNFRLQITDVDLGDAFAVICSVRDLQRISNDIGKRGLTVHKAEEQLVPIVRVELEVTRSIVCLIEIYLLQPAMQEKLAELYAALQAEVSEIDSIFDNISWSES